jgi:hypothetical protein
MTGRAGMGTGGTLFIGELRPIPSGSRGLIFVLSEEQSETNEDLLNGLAVRNFIL